MAYPSKFISPKKLKTLQEAIAFLDNYKTPMGEEHLITTEPVDGIASVDGKKTRLLSRLGEINVEREDIINQLLEEK